MTKRELELIWGNEQIINWFGFWPSFHDAEVHWIKLQRSVPVIGNGTSIELVVHTWELTDQIDDQGFFVTNKHCLIHFRFDDCREVQLEGFNFQNVLFEFGFTIDGAGQDIHLQVNLDPSYGVGGTFKCDHVEVFGVTPCDKEGLPLSS